MRGGAGDDHRLLPPGKDNDLSGRLRVGNKAEIGAVVHHGLVNLLRPQVADLELRGGQAAGEFGLEARHLRDADGIDRSNPDAAAGVATHLLEADKEFLVAAEHIASELIKELARGQHLERAAGAVQQLHAKDAFEFLQRLAGGRLGDAIEGGAPADAARLHNVAEQMELREVHDRDSIIRPADVEATTNSL